MEEIYWIDVIEKVDVVIMAVCGFCLFLAICFLLGGNNNETKEEQARRGRSTVLCMLGFITLLLLTLAIPGRSDLYRIYGMSGVIESMKKEKPVDQKYIQALDNWMKHESSKNNY
jgi:hypothetical protein